MSKLSALVAGAMLIVALISGWYFKQLHDAEERGVALEKSKAAAQANQNIAERRLKDAEFDKMDARQHCLDAGLEWVFDDGKSFCR